MNAVLYRAPSDRLEMSCMAMHGQKRSRTAKLPERVLAPCSHKFCYTAHRRTRLTTYNVVFLLLLLHVMLGMVHTDKQEPV
jgi:hypothetical protein